MCQSAPDSTPCARLIPGSVLMSCRANCIFFETRFCHTWILNNPDSWGIAIDGTNHHTLSCIICFSSKWLLPVFIISYHTPCWTQTIIVHFSVYGNSDYNYLEYASVYTVLHKRWDRNSTFTQRLLRWSLFFIRKMWRDICKWTEQIMPVSPTLGMSDISNLIMKNTLVWKCCFFCCHTVHALYNREIWFPGIYSKPQFYPADIPWGKLRISSAFQTEFCGQFPWTCPLKTKWALVCPSPWANLSPSLT